MKNTMFRVPVFAFVLAVMMCARLIYANAQSSSQIYGYSEFVDIPGKDGVPWDTTEIIVRVGNITKDTASTNEIIANRGLRIVTKGYPAHFRIAVLSFAITTVKQPGDTVAANVSTVGNMLSTDQIRALYKLNGSGQVIFHAIRAAGGSSRVRELDPISLIIRL